MKEVRFKKGARLPNWSAIIYLLWKFLLRRPITIVFTAASRYQVDPKEQADWLKIGGRGGLMAKKTNRGWIREKENLVVWRYNVQADIFQVSEDYGREDYEMKLPTRDQIKNVPENFGITLDSSKLKGWLPMPPYFGGTLPAPHEVKFFVK